jgi:type I restriction-modification system DNA methylase subunit
MLHLRCQWIAKSWDNFCASIFNSFIKPGGRAAVVLPDNVLFEDGQGRAIRLT